MSFFPNRRPSELHTVVGETQRLVERDKELHVSRRPACQNLMHPAALNKNQQGEHAPFRVGVPFTQEEEKMGIHGQWVSIANQLPESLDYEEQENLLLENERAATFGNTHPKAWKQWIILMLIGCSTAVVAFAINEGITKLVSWKFSAVEHYMQTTATPSDPRPTIEFFRPYLLCCLFNLAYVLIAAALVIVGEPLAKGSGISEIKCYLNGVRLPRVVRIKTLACKAIGIMFSVAGALPCGKEGPMIHSGAVIASGISTGKSTMLRMDSGFWKEFRSERHRRFFITAGAASGVAAAFGAPIGGLLFAVEEVASFWKVEMTVMVFCCSSITPFVLQLLQAPDSYGSGAIRGLIDFGVVQGGYRTIDIPFIALLGVCGGLMGAFFIHLNLKIAALRQRFVKTKIHQFVEAGVMSLTVSTVLMVLVTRLYDCVNVADRGTPRSKIRTYGCPDGTYNDMATYFFPMMEDSISLLIHAETDIHYSTLAKQLVPYFFLTCLNFGTMVPSGLFLPSLALGASFGHLYAQLWNMMLPSGSRLDPAAYALFGATAVLGGVVRMTISVIVIIMEATNNITFFYPLVIITVFAKITGDVFNQGIYDMYIKFNKIPLLGSQLDSPVQYLLIAKDVVNTRIVRATLSISVGKLVNLLKLFPRHNVLVVEDPAQEGGRFRGLLLRRTALILITERAWERELNLKDFVQSGKERELLCLKKYRVFDRLSDDDKQQELDLLPFVDQWPHCFPETTPLPRIHRTFRELGLRYIVVLDGQSRAVGVVARKQLCLLDFVDPRELPDEEPFKGRIRRATLTSSTPRGSPMGGPVSSVSSFTDDIAEEEWTDAHREGIN
jgi:chloride channel 7